MHMHAEDVTVQHKSYKLLDAFQHQANTSTTTDGSFASEVSHDSFV